MYTRGMFIPLRDKSKVGKIYSQKIMSKNPMTEFSVTSLTKGKEKRGGKGILLKRMTTSISSEGLLPFVA